MNRTVLTILAVFQICLVLPGCGNGKVFKQAQTAEKRGRPEVAYEEYCKAARENRGSGAVIEGLSRTREHAAAFWEKRALLAIDDSRYVDAWRMLMRVLEIQPDESSSADLIRRLEKEHEAELAGPREEYVKRGSVTLVATLRQEMALAGGASTPMSQETRIAQGPAAPELTLTDTGRKSEEVSTEEVTPANHAEQAIQAPSDSKEFVAVSKQPWTSGQKLVDGQPQVHLNPDGDEVSSATEADVSRSSHDSPKVKKKSSKKRSKESLAGSRRADNRRAGEFEIVCTLSKRDSRYSRDVTILERIELRLRETDDDPDADLDVFEGNRRLKKLRGMEIGESQSFSSRDGRLFRITILSIHDPSKTVRVGIRPA
jgi:hypothetical protein